LVERFEYSERQADLMLSGGPFGDHATVRGVYRLTVNDFGYDLLPIE